MRTSVFAATSTAVVLGTSQLLPGAGGKSGTPAGIIALGVIYGLLTAMIAAGIILIYRTSRIINFAQAAIGAAGGVFAYNLAVAETTSFPFFLAFAIGLLTAGVLGALLEVALVRRFFNAPRLVLMVLTIAVVPALGFAAGFVRNLPIFGEPEDRDPLLDLGTLKVAMPFEFEFQIGRLSIPFGFGHVFALVMSILAFVGLAAFFRYTRAGVAVRASAENADRAMLLGINVRGLSTVVWTITGLLSGLGVMLNAVVADSWQSVGGQNPGTLVVALAAAVIARMKSLPVAVVAGVCLEIIRQSINWSFRENVNVFDALLFFIILVGLLMQRKEMQRSEEGDTSSWKATEEVRPIPKEMLQIGGLRIWRFVLAFAGLAFLLVYPWATSVAATNSGGYFAIIGITMLSLVVLTGWAGQVSLGQFALVGVGALVGGALTSKMDISFWLALPIGTLFTAGFALLIGLPALRIKGLFLAVTTYAFAFAVQSNLFEKEYFGAILPDAVDRPKLLFLDFEDERSMYYLLLLSFVLCIVVVTSLRRSRWGRVLIALRENENNVQSFGINAVRTRLAAFALSGALCGFAGVLLAHHQRAVTSAEFPAQESLFVFIDGVIGGLGSVAGAIMGAIYFGMFRLLGTNPIAGLIIGPIGILVVLYVAPGGLTSVLFGMRDAVLKIIAQRRRMVVPSLFADVDPTAIERQVAPLAEPLPGVGLAVLPFDQRYKTHSDLYYNRGKIAARSGRAPDDKKAFGAAAGNIEEFGANLESPKEVAAVKGAD